MVITKNFDQICLWWWSF